MKRAYRWRCFACDEPNAPSATSCARCGFPARATGAEIARGQAAFRGGITPVPAADRRTSPAIAPARAGWTGWPMGFAIAGAVLLAIGAYAGNEVLSWRGLGVTVLTLIFGLLLLLVAWEARNVAPRT